MEKFPELCRRLYAAVSSGDYEAIDQLGVPNFTEHESDGIRPILKKRIPDKIWLEGHFDSHTGATPWISNNLRLAT